jgi:TonB family protein
MAMVTRRFGNLVVVALTGLTLGALAPAPLLAQESPLATARDLYSAARYDEALALLNGLRPQEQGNTANLRSIEQYRSLCLLALGRSAEAEVAIAAVVAADPMYLPTETEASPRVRSAFSEVRQRQLPEIARTRYSAAKASFDRKEFPAAEQQFRDLLKLIDDPDMGGRLADLRVLVSGFVDLSTASAPPPAAPEPARPEPRREEPPAPVQPAIDPMRVFTGDDEGVAIATAIRQEVPRVPVQISSQTRERGLLEVTIDEQGRVIQAKLRLSLHPIYDAQLLSAARDWRYQPAMYQGKPVKFRKIIQITVTK